MNKSDNKPDKKLQKEATAAESLTDDHAANESAAKAKPQAQKPQTEHGGPKGLEPTRYGDWERNGRCTDF